MMNKIKTMAAGVTAAALCIPALASAQATVTPLALRAAQDYQLQARFPEWSRAVAIGDVDPVLSDRSPTRQSRTGPDGADPRITVWNSAMTVLPGQSVDLFVQLDRTQGANTLLGNTSEKVTALKVTGEAIGEHSGSAGSFAYADDGAGADAIAGDGIYSARFTMPEAAAPELGQAESYMVKAEAVLEGGDLRRAAGGFVYSNPAARLTGKVVDSVVDGNLVMSIELEVLAPGRVHLSGTLADQIGTPFVSAQNAGHLDKGIHTLDLRFYGLAFHERAISGPVSLTSLALTSANGMPNAMAPLATDLHISAPVNLATLNAAPFNDPALLEAAARALGSVK